MDPISNNNRVINNKNSRQSLTILCKRLAAEYFEHLYIELSLRMIM